MIPTNEKALRSMQDELDRVDRLIFEAILKDVAAGQWTPEVEYRALWMMQADHHPVCLFWITRREQIFRPGPWSSPTVIRRMKRLFKAWQEGLRRKSARRCEDGHVKYMYRRACEREETEPRLKLVRPPSDEELRADQERMTADLAPRLADLRAQVADERRDLAKHLHWLAGQLKR